MSEAQEAAVFKDASGREWTVAFNLGIVRDLKDTVGFDFADLQDGRAFVAISNDMQKFCIMLWMLCEKQADAFKVSEEEFAKGIDAEALEQASDAIVAAVVNFTQPRIRPAVKEVYERIASAQEAGVETLREWAETGEIEKEIKKQMKEELRGFGKSSPS